MLRFIVLLPVLPLICLLAGSLLPSRIANQFACTTRRLVVLLAGVQLLVAVTLATLWFAGGASPVDLVLLKIGAAQVPLISLYFDGATALMLLLVSLVGWIICRYSVRYLDGDPDQGRYFRWTAVTIGAVSLMVLAGNLLQFAIAWAMTSWGLHHLLQHFPNRPEARRAAWTKFTVSRFGDLFLLAAVVLTYQSFRTWEFADIFAALQSGDTPTAATAAIGWFLVIGAAIKSAQFPFHTWLPLSLETPTPVSALMHAGIVNAGGYLMIRTSPLLAATPAALTSLAVVGAITVFFGSVVMLTQSSIKRSLAYSTVAQMGFMMLQCGLGAFSAAMLHIIAHSLYKAHEFLGSGSVLAQQTSTRVPAARSKQTPRRSWPILAGAVGTAMLCYTVVVLISSFALINKSGGIVLGSIICLALSHWIWLAFMTGQRRFQAAGVAVGGLLVALYAAGLALVDLIVPSTFVAFTPAATWIVGGLVVLSFGSLLCLQVLLRQPRRPRWLDAFYVHAANGFYLDTVTRRIFPSVVSS